jgi:large conductance mechanosensitive channel
MKTNGSKAMLSEFKTFLNQGNVLGLAIGVLIGAAFGKLVQSFTDDILMPIIGALTGGGVDFSNKYMVLSGNPAPGTSLEAARAGGANILAYGSMISAIITFIIMAFVIFMITKQANKLMAPEADAGPTEDTLLLRDIRDSLKK